MNSVHKTEFAASNSMGVAVPKIKTLRGYIKYIERKHKEAIRRYRGEDIPPWCPIYFKDKHDVTLDALNLLRHINMKTVCDVESLGNIGLCPPGSPVPYGGAVGLEDVRLIARNELGIRVKKILTSLSPGDVSFKNDLSSAKVLIGGPGPTDFDIWLFLTQFPNIGIINLLEIKAEHFRVIDDFLEYRTRSDFRTKCEINGFLAPLQSIPKCLYGEIDIIFDKLVFHEDYMNGTVAKQEFEKTLKHGGVHISCGTDWCGKIDSYDSPNMQEINTGDKEIKAFLKV